MTSVASPSSTDDRRVDVAGPQRRAHRCQPFGGQPGSASDLGLEPLGDIRDFGASPPLELHIDQVADVVLADAPAQCSGVQLAHPRRHAFRQRRNHIGAPANLAAHEHHLSGHCHVGECRRPGRIGGVSTATASYKGHRYPVEIINHCVWLYFRFPLSFREVEELMLVRGVAVSYETIRRWCAKFGQAYANQLRRRRPRPGDKWHLDEVFVKINGITGYLWRAVDQHGNVLDVLVQSRRNAKAAKRFFRKLLKGLHMYRACW